MLVMFALVAHHASAEYYELRIYHLAAGNDGSVLENYLKNALIPALHRMGTRTVGVFKPVETDTVNASRIYVLIPHPTLEDVEQMNDRLAKDQQYQVDGKDFINAPYNAPPYLRMETILLHSFPLMEQLSVPKLTSPKTERIYELRSYESPTERLNLNKVRMFNAGGEIALFSKLNCNAVFYSEVISGSHMPNLMYMTSYENREDRDAHWKAFGDAPEWKALQSMEEYKNNVSKADVFLLHGVDYSDI